MRQSNSPQFSVIVPTYSRQELLRACLYGLGRQSFPHSQFQVLVVNDGGAELPADLVRGCEREFRLVVLEQANSGQSAARNLGAAHATGEWLAFIDDDCVPEPDWLMRFAEAFIAEPDAVVGGETRNGLPGNVYSLASQALMSYLYEYYNLRTGEHAQLSYFTSNNFALKRQNFSRVGGFDEGMRFAEDRDLCARLVKAGFRLLAVPEARVLHFRPLNFRSFWGQHQAYGSGAFNYYGNRQRAGTADFRVEPIRFYTAMLLYARRYAPHDSVRVAALIALSQLANGYGFVQALVRARARQPITDALISL
jgi:cellulose synthase/poly-beta-1,6-N-acetylglucosamine synthase-like glycosyltransferase